MNKEKNTETLAETKMRIIKEDIISLDARAQRILEERVKLIVKLVRTREVMSNNG